MLAQSSNSKTNPIELDGVAKEPVLVMRSLVLGYCGEALIRIPQMCVTVREIVTIVGPSGIGKTTLFATLAGEVPPIGGEFFIGGAKFGQGLRRNFVTRTLQGHSLFHWLTVRENLALAARIRGVKGVDFDDTLATFSAQALGNRFPATLSGGERCRASLSQSLLGDPNLLLLDEPFAGLDPLVKQSVSGNLFSIARSSNAAIVVISHDIADAVEFSDRVLVLGGERPATIIEEVQTDSVDAMQTVRQALGVGR